MLSLRLKTVASFVPDNSEIINVGTDHALLEIFLAQSKNVNSIGIDISPVSVYRAKKNIAREGLEKKVCILQNDGLKEINVGNKIITISGLGTQTILNILKDVSGNDLIIQSNNNLYELRKKICQKGYYIYDEKAIYDKRWYVIIYFKVGKEDYCDFDLYRGPKIHDIEYIEYLIRINTKLLQNIPMDNSLKKLEIKKLIYKLKNCR